MKKSISSILDNCTPQELDGVLDSVGADLPPETSAARLSALAQQKAGVSVRPHRARRLALLAACIALVAAILVGCYVAEQNEYNNAVRFFDLNHLDTEGMSRSDIKRVWHDIDTERFAYNESYQLLSRSSGTEHVQGVEIGISNSLNNAISNDQIDSLNLGVPLFEGYGDIPYGTQYFLGDELEKNVNGETVWRTKLPHTFSRYYIAGGKALIWGAYIYDNVHDYMHTCIALIDDTDGKILWEKTLDSRYHFDEGGIAAAADDDRIAVLTLATDDRFSDGQALVFRELDESGKVVKEREQSAEEIVFLERMIPLSEGWLAVIRNNGDAEYSLSTTISSYTMGLITRLMQLDKDGMPVREWNINSVGSEEIADIKEYNGKIYLSVQEQNNSDALNQSLDYNNIPADGNSLADGFTDELRDAAREEFSSVLYVYDPDTAKPGEFYSVKGTMPGKLYTDGDGNLVWSVGRIVKCGWAPWANSFQYYGLIRRYDYTFSGDNTVLKEEKTNQFDSFRVL